MDVALDFDICLPREPVAPGDTVIVTVRLHNTSSQDLYVSSRFAAAPGIGDLQPTVMGPGGELSSTRRVKIPPASLSDFSLLEAGEALFAAFELSWSYDLATPGDYEVTVDYVNEQAPAELDDHPVFTGSLRSSTQTLAVTSS